MSKKAIGFLFGMVVGAALTMLYLHRDVIVASLTGGELPEAPASCPCSCLNKDGDD